MTHVFEYPPALMGHRGFGKNAEGRPPENTVASFQAAVEAGVDWIELDIRRSADNALVLLHEPSLPDGGRVVTQSAADLRAAGVITLDDALDAIPSDVGINIEVKPTLEDALAPLEASAAALLCPVLEREQGQRRLLVSSFDATALTFVRSRVPSAPLGYIGWLGYPLEMAVVTATHLGAQVLMAQLRSFEQPKATTRPTPARAVEVARQAGLEIGVWSSPPQDVAGYVRAGVDVVTVDDVPGGLAALQGALVTEASEDPGALAPESSDVTQSAGS